MTNQQLFNHYSKRIRLCESIIKSLPNNAMNPKWTVFVNLNRYYDKIRQTIDLSGRTEAQLVDRRNVGNYGNYFSDPVEMEKYKKKVNLYNK